MDVSAGAAEPDPPLVAPAQVPLAGLGASDSHVETAHMAVPSYSGNSNRALAQLRPTYPSHSASHQHMLFKWLWIPMETLDLTSAHPATLSEVTL
jgi:hypothetical protein